MSNPNNAVEVLQAQLSAIVGTPDTDPFVLSTALDTDATLAANSDAKVATQKATKAAIATALTAAEAYTDGHAAPDAGLLPFAAHGAPGFTFGTTYTNGTRRRIVNFSILCRTSANGDGASARVYADTGSGTADHQFDLGKTREGDSAISGQNDIYLTGSFVVAPGGTYRIDTNLSGSGALFATSLNTVDL